MEALLPPSAHSDIGAQNHARHRNADEEHNKEKKGFVEALPRGASAVSVPHSAKHERMTATVAVVRWSHRSAAHNSGKIARNPNASRYAVSPMSGLYATIPTAIAVTTTAPVARNWERPRDCGSIVAHKTTKGATTSAPAASPSHQVIRIGAKAAGSAWPAKVRLPHPPTWH